MLYKAVGGATVFFASLSILTQIVLLPYLFNHSDNLKHIFKQRIQRFNAYANQFDIQAARLHQLGARPRRQILDPEEIIRERCPPPYPGPPGPPGEPGQDGESGFPGKDGRRGLDAQTQLADLYNQCIVCPAGPPGHVGPPGPRGFEGAPGERGDPGKPGIDGSDGEQGPEGDVGKPGNPGKPGKPGPPGIPAPGGTGPPGEKGSPGPVGAPGPQGPRGTKNFVYGPTGLEGQPGTPGYDGIDGKPGPRGPRGPPGVPGSHAKFCPCPVELSLIKGSHPSSKTPEVGDAKSIAYGSRNVESAPLPIAEQGAQTSSSSSSKHGISRQKSRAPQPPPQPLPSESHTSESKVKNIAYEDAYPTYDQSTTRRKDYDDVPDATESLHDGGNSRENTKLHDGEQDISLSFQNDASPEHKFVDVNLNELDPTNGDSATQAPTIPQEITTRRKFNYVTKKPRAGLIWN